MGSFSDPIANLLTKIRNAKEAEHRYIDIEWSVLKEEIVKILKEQGFISQVLVKEEKKKKYHRIERGYGTFVRSFTLPDDADASKVKAEFKNGLLTVHLPKSEKAKPKQIEVNIA